MPRNAPALIFHPSPHRPVEYRSGDRFVQKSVASFQKFEFDLQWKNNAEQEKGFF